MSGLAKEHFATTALPISMEIITMRRRRQAITLLSVLPVLAGIVALAQPAEAAAACPSGAVCFYQDYNGRGSISVQPRLVSGSHQIADFRNSHYINGQNLNDSASSIINNSGRTLCLFANVNFDKILWVGAGWIAAGHAVNIPNDMVSSAKTGGC